MPCDIRLRWYEGFRHGAAAAGVVVHPSRLINFWQPVVCDLDSIVDSVDGTRRFQTRDSFPPDSPLSLRYLSIYSGRGQYPDWFSHCLDAIA
jgi:hypothetical protein